MKKFTLPVDIYEQFKTLIGNTITYTRAVPLLAALDEYGKIEEVEGVPIVDALKADEILGKNGKKAVV